MNELKEKSCIDAFITGLDASEQTKRTYSRALNRFIDWTEKNNIENVGQAEIVQFKKDLERIYKSATVNIYLAALKQFYKYLNNTYGVIDCAKAVKKEKESCLFKKDSLTYNQVKTILNGLKKGNEEETRDRAIFILMVLTGIREIETVRANIEDIQIRTGSRVLMIQGKGQTEKNDYVVLYSLVSDAIQDYLRFRTDADATEPLFTSISNRNRGKRLTTRTIQNIITDILKKNGIISERITTHSLRHTAITLSILNGANVQQAQQMARHKDINITMRYFTDLNRLSDNAEKKLNDLFK